MTLHVAALRAVPINGYTSVEYEAIAFPEILVVIDILRVFQNTALQIVGLVNAFIRNQYGARRPRSLALVLQASPQFRGILNVSESMKGSNIHKRS